MLPAARLRRAPGVSDRGELRRLCSMQTCGNRAKVAAFRSREIDRSASRKAADPERSATP